MYNVPPTKGKGGKYYLYIFQIALSKVAGSWELAASAVLVFLSLLYKRVIEPSVFWSAGKSIHPTNLHMHLANVLSPIHDSVAFLCSP